MLKPHSDISMKPIQFRWIEAFRAVALTGSTTEAAQILRVDQSAVSRHISALEGQLGLTLFERRPRSLKLTVEGASLVPEAEAAIDALKRFQARAGELSKLTGGHLHIITSATLARGLFPAVLSIFRARASDVTIHVEVVARTELDKKIDAQQFDLCAIAQPFAYPAEHTLGLGKFSGVCLVPKEHALALRTVISLADLAGEPLVGLSVGTVGRARIDDLFRRAEMRYQPCVETTAVALTECVAAGLGLAITDPFSARAADRGLVVAKPLTPTIDYEFGLLFPLNRGKSALVNNFAEVICECARL